MSPDNTPEVVTPKNPNVSEMTDRELLEAIYAQQAQILLLAQTAVQVIEQGKAQLEPMMNNPMFKGLAGFMRR